MTRAALALLALAPIARRPLCRLRRRVRRAMPSGSAGFALAGSLALALLTACDPNEAIPSPIAHMLIDDMQDYGDQFVNIGPEKTVWYTAGVPAFGLAGDEHLGSKAAPPILRPVADELLDCGIGADDALAAEVTIWFEDGGPWPVRWREDNRIPAGAQSCAADALSGLTFPPQVDAHFGGVVVFRVYGRDLIAAAGR